MQLDQVLDEGQPEPESAVRARAGAIALAEALEHVREEVRRDAVAGVGDDDLEVGIGPPQARLDAALPGGELHGIAEQVPHHLLEPVRIPGDRAGIGLSKHVEADALGEGGGTHRVRRGVDDRPQLDAL